MRQLTERQVKEHVHNIVGYGGEFRLSRHARKRMRDRNYNLNDLRKIILEGSLIDSEENIDAGNWKYTFNGEDLDGDDGSVVITLITIRECVIITVLS